MDCNTYHLQSELFSTRSGSKCDMLGILLNVWRVLQAGHSLCEAEAENAMLIWTSV